MSVIGRFLDVFDHTVSAKTRPIANGNRWTSSHVGIDPVSMRRTGKRAGRDRAGEGLRTERWSYASPSQKEADADPEATRSQRLERDVTHMSIT